MTTESAFAEFEALLKQALAIEQELKNNPDYFFGFRVDLGTGEIIDSVGWHKKIPGEPALPLDELLET